MIRNREGFDEALPADYDGEFLWDFFNPAWAGTNIQPMDIDAMVERGGIFLMFETKAEGVPVKSGQRTALERLIKATRGAATVVLCAKTPATIRGWQVWRLSKAGNIVRVDHTGTAADLVKWCRAWFLAASQLPIPIFRGVARPDLFRDQITNPIERAIYFFEELTDTERATFLNRIGF